MYIAQDNKHETDNFTQYLKIPLEAQMDLR